MRSYRVAEFRSCEVTELQSYRVAEFRSREVATRGHGSQDRSRRRLCRRQGFCRVLRCCAWPSCSTNITAPNGAWKHLGRTGISFSIFHSQFSVLRWRPPFSEFIAIVFFLRRLRRSRQIANSAVLRLRATERRYPEKCEKMRKNRAEITRFAQIRVQKYAYFLRYRQETP